MGYLWWFWFFGWRGNWCEIFGCFFSGRGREEGGSQQSRRDLERLEPTSLSVFSISRSLSLSVAPLPLQCSPFSLAESPAPSVTRSPCHARDVPLSRRAAGCRTWPTRSGLCRPERNLRGRRRSFFWFQFRLCLATTFRDLNRLFFLPRLYRAQRASCCLRRAGNCRGGSAREEGEQEAGARAEEKGARMPFALLLSLSLSPFFSPRMLFCFFVCFALVCLFFSFYSPWYCTMNGQRY